MNFPAMPRGYRLIAVWNLMRNRKQLKAVVYLSLTLTVIPLALGILLIPFAPTLALIRQSWWCIPATLGLYIAYILLHELTHGIPMLLLSGVMPRFGLTLCYAYAGSNVWFDRRSHCFIALLPLIVYTTVLTAVMLLVPAGWRWPVYFIQISNVSGCAGDIWCVAQLRKLPKNILIQDTGVRMRIIAPGTSEEVEK
ncbi:MAG: DUF3267 domain-containing protein [Christensenellales bacterium]|nr:DUF3267 domain-containing protein [Christensenellales bacterium]